MKSKYNYYFTSYLTPGPVRRFHRVASCIFAAKLMGYTHLHEGNYKFDNDRCDACGKYLRVTPRTVKGK